MDVLEGVADVPQSKIHSHQSRPLGARGSRAEVGSDDPAADLTPTATAVLSAIPAWWSTQAANAGLGGRWLDVRQALAASPPVDLPDKGSSDLAASWGPLQPDQVGAAYVESLSAATRARHGRHYTPPHLAQQMWEHVKRAQHLKDETNALPGLVRDPACGAAALLLPILREHLLASWDLDPQLVLRRLPQLIEGIDTDPSAVWVANVVLAAEMLPTLARVPENLRRPLPALARVGDGLARDLRAARIVVLNPPYGRVRLTDGDRQRFAATLYGHANLYGIFMHAAEESLDATGAMTVLVPTSFTAGRYFASLRRHLTSAMRLDQVDFIADRSGVFSSVLQETCLATFTRRRVRKTVVSTIGSERVGIATVSTPRGDAPWILPRRTDLAPVAAAAAALPLTLRDCGWKVSTGPLVWNRRKEDLSARPGRDRYPIIWAADIDGGDLHRDDARRSTRYLRLALGERKTYLLDESAILVQRTTAPEQIRRLVAAEFGETQRERWGAVVVENHVNVLRPVGEPLLSPALLIRLLRSSTLDKLLRCISGSVALSAYELESLTLPSREVLNKWERLSEDDLEREVARTYATTIG